MKPTRKASGKTPEPVKCPHCGKKAVKAGLRKNKLQATQKYLCPSCRKYFIDRELKKKLYPAKTILKAISLYNLGYTQEAVSGVLKRRYNKAVPRKTISNWITSYRTPCTYHTLRKEAVELYKPKEVILSDKLMHRQVYNFKVHQAKLSLFEERDTPQKEKIKALKTYLGKITDKSAKEKPFPHHIFTIAPENDQNEKRASKLDMELLKITKREKKNYANKLAELALKISPNNYARHQTVQDFMLINDSVTIAAEVPVYLAKSDIAYYKDKNFKFSFRNYRTPITGHIDLLQIRNGLIYILDYKPEAEKINPIEQLTIYALALASRTKLPLKGFKCAWFDDRNYYEFFPLEAVHEKTV